MSIVKQIIGKNGITNGEDLSKIAKQVFGTRFRGVFVVNKPQDIPTLLPTQIAILNTNMHWYVAWKDKNGNLFESDSYGIDELGPKYKDKRPPKTFLQGKGKDLKDCGSRAIVNMIFDAL